MALDSSELFVAGTGNIYVAPYGTSMPNAIDDTLDADFVDLGFLSEDGFRFTPALEKIDLYGWQSEDPLRNVVTKRPKTISLDFMQSNTDVFQLYFGGGTFNGTVYSPPTTGEVDERSLVADVTDGERLWRFWFVKVTVATNREVSFTRSKNAEWGVDLSVLGVGSGDAWNFDYDDSQFPAYPN